MTTGISVNVGLDNVSSNIYSAPALLGAEKDAKAMFNIAMTQGFDMNLSKLLLGSAATVDKKATFDNVKNAVLQAAEVLQPGDLFFFSFAGHGTFKVLNSAAEEPDKHDESIVLSDHFMIDNFWRKKLWPKFKPGVRIIAIADSCHSETTFFAPPIGSSTNAEAASVDFARNVISRAGDWPGAIAISEHVPSGKSIRQAPEFRRIIGAVDDVVSRATDWSSDVVVSGDVPQEIRSGKPGPVAQAPKFRLITAVERKKELDEFPEFYSSQSAASPQAINATRLFLSACKDDQKAADGEDNGAFTAALLKVWDNGNFPGNYTQLMTEVVTGFNGTNQTPVLTKMGAPDFSSEKPFTI